MIRPPFVMRLWSALTLAGYSMQARLLRRVLSGVAIVWIVAMVVTWFDTQHEIDELLDAHLSQAAALLVSESLDDLTSRAQYKIPVLHKYQSRVVLQVWHGDVLMVHSATAPQTPLAAPTQRGFSDTRIGTQQWRVFSTPGQDAGVLIHVAEQDKSRKDVMRANLRSLLWAMTMAFPFLGLVVWWAVGSAVKPLKELSLQVGRHKPDTAQPLALDTAPREVQPVVQELNRLFARTAQLIDTERRFTADAAHELRTPIAAIRMQAQVAQGANDDTERQTALRATIQGCDRAARLVEQLLQLARLEVQTQADVVACSAWTSAEMVQTDLQHWAQQRQQHLWLQGDPSAMMPVPDAFASVLLRNLTDNALRYSPIEAQIRITIEQGMCRVEDSGPGLSDTDMARLGERFFRVLGSGQPGSGLGWSIVTRITRLYGLQLQLGRSADLGGLSVSITWPTTASGASSTPPV